MADRYWVGGTGTWNGSTTTNWSDVSGGVGGASAPTSADDVYFDSNSSSAVFTVTLGTATNRNITISGINQVLTLIGTGTWSVSGDLLFQAGALINNQHTGSMNFNGVAGTTNYITTNGVKLIPGTPFWIRLNINSGKWVLGSSLETGNSGYMGGFYIYGGIFDTAGYTVTCNNCYIAGSASKEIYLRSSQVYPRGAFVIDATGSLVFDAGTSTIDTSGGGFINVYSNIPIILHNLMLRKPLASYIGNITANNITIAETFPYNPPLCLINPVVVLGTLKLNDQQHIISNGLGTRRTLSVNIISLPSDRPIIFRDINFAGNASPLYGANVGDAGNNSGIVFPAAKTVYCVSSTLFSPIAKTWATTSGGVGTQFILPQDTGIIDNASPAAISWPYSAAYILGSLNAETRTTPLTLTINNSGAAQQHIYATFNGDLKLSSAVTFVTPSGDYIIGQVLSFQGFKDQLLKLSGQQLTSVWCSKNNSSLILDSDVSISSTKTLYLESGILSLNGYKLTTPVFSSSNANVRTLNLGSGNLTITGTGTVFNAANSTNLTVTGTGSINMTSASAKTFAGGGKSYPTLNQGGSGNLTITGANTFDRISNTVYPATVIFPANTTTTVANFSLSGSSEGQLTMVSSTANTRFTLSKSSGHIAPYNCTIKDSNVVGGATWRAPANYGNVNAGNNLGWNYADIDTKLNNFFFYFEDPIAV